MTELFLKVLNLSIGAVPLMAVLLVLRLLFKKAVPRKVFYIAWALVFLRLMVPFSLESDLSIFNFVPKAAVVEENVGTSVVFVENENERVEFPVFISPDNENPNVDRVHHSVITGEIVTGPDITTVPMDKNLILSTVWIFGTGALLLFGIIGYFTVLKKTKFESVEYTKNIRLSEFFKTPVVCGLFRPKIILPMNFDLDDEAKITSVIAHEGTHIRRGDNFWRLLASFTLYVHWFNPLVWICYDAFIRDMEVSCDEEVLKKSKSDIRSEYAESLVSLSGEGTNPLYGGVLSFGESAIKERVKCIMNFKRATLLIVIICIAVAAALGVIFLTNPSVTGEKEPEYEIVLKKGTAVSYSRESGIEMEAVITNTGDKTIWLDSAIIIQAEIDGKTEFAGTCGNGGVLMLPSGFSALFCGDIQKENFEGDFEFYLPEGKYTLRRAIFFDEALTPTNIYAEFSFEIVETKEASLYKEFYGVFAAGIANELIPDQRNLPTEELWADTRLGKYCYSIIGVLKNVNSISVVLSPSDEQTIVEMTREQAEEIMSTIKSDVNLYTTSEPYNPSTGGTITISITTLDDRIDIWYDGRVLISQEGQPYVYVFSGEYCKETFNRIKEICEEALGKPVIDEEPEINPAIGVPTVPTEKEPETGENSIFTTYDLSVTFFNNTDKIAVPYEYALTVAKLGESLYEIESSELGNVSEIIDAVEIVRNTDGKKYHINLYEYGFTLSGSAVPEEYLGKAFTLPTDEWNELCEIIKEVNLSKNTIPYWIGLIHEKNVESVYVDDAEGNGSIIYPTDDCFSLIIERLLGFTVPGDLDRIEKADFVAPDEKHLSMVITFNNGTVYNMVFTRTYLSMVSNDTSYGLKYYTEIDGYDEFLDFAEGGPANPMTGKPVIYLYPEKETEVSVNLDFDGKLTYTYPALGSGWRVLAKPDGTLTNLADNSTHYYLFWEGTARPEWTYEKGFVVKGSETEAFLRENLAKMGLTPREYNDFITYWVPKMQENPYNLISFSGEEYSEIAKLTVNPKPDSVIRIHMMWKALDEPIEIEPQVLPVYERKGFVLVEWGGTELY